jgi:subtilisin family serine protease
VIAAVAVVVSGCTSGATPDPMPDPVPDKAIASYIVGLRDMTGDVESVATGLVRRHGGRVDRVYSHALRGFSATLTAGDARRIATDPAVAQVEPDGAMAGEVARSPGVVTPAAVADPTPAYGRDRIDQRGDTLDGQFRYTATGDGVHAYILSSGINIGHVDFGGRASYGWDFHDNDATAADDHPQCRGAGSSYASLIAGATTHSIAKSAMPVAVRINDGCNSPAISTVLAGVDWVAQHAIRPAVVFLPWYEEWSAGKYATLETAINNSVQSGLTYVVPAGFTGPSGGDSCRMFPARMPSVISVSTTGPMPGVPAADMQRTPIASFGGCITIFAPGHAYVGVSSGDSIGLSLNFGDPGTAAAHVAGVVALMLEVHPTRTPADVRAALVADATVGVVIDRGLGAPNLFLHSWPGVDLTCESRRSRIFCRVSSPEDVPPEIRWWLAGSPVPNWADDPMVNGGCVAGNAYSVKVEVTNLIGMVDTVTTNVTCRSGNP